MSIATKTGDEGTTALLFQRRVSKNHPRVRVYGAVDELTSAIGMARAAAVSGETAAFLKSVQEELIYVMGELAVDEADRERFLKSKLGRIGEDAVGRLDRKIEVLENATGGFSGWSLPGDSEPGARLEVARGQCRRSERKVVALKESGAQVRDLLLVYLNRLSDCLWLLAREADGYGVGKNADA